MCLRNESGNVDSYRIILHLPQGTQHYAHVLSPQCTGRDVPEKKSGNVDSYGVILHLPQGAQHYAHVLSPQSTGRDVPEKNQGMLTHTESYYICRKVLSTTHTC